MRNDNARAEVSAPEDIAEEGRGSTTSGIAQQRPFKVSIFLKIRKCEVKIVKRRKRAGPTHLGRKGTFQFALLETHREIDENVCEEPYTYIGSVVGV